MARDCTACPSTFKQSKEAACDSKCNWSDRLTANVNQRPVQSQVKAMTLNYLLRAGARAVVLCSVSRWRVNTQRNHPVLFRVFFKTNDSIIIAVHSPALLSPAPPWCDTPWAGNHVIVFILGTAHGSYHHCYNYARRHKWCSRVPSSHLTQNSRDTGSAGVAVELFCFMFAIWWPEWAVTCLVIFFFNLFFIFKQVGKEPKPTTFSLVSGYSDLNGLNGSKDL